MDNEKKVSSGYVVLIVFLVFLVICFTGFIAYKEISKKKEPGTITKPDNTNSGIVLSSPENGKSGFYKLEVTGLKKNDKVVYKLNDDFYVELDVIDDVYTSFDVLVNGKKLATESGYAKDELSFYFINNMLLYETYKGDFDRDLYLYAINKTGNVSEIRELDDVKGMAPSSISYNGDEIIIEASRVTEGPSLIYGDKVISLIDCNKNLSEIEANKDIVVKAKYTSKFVNNELTFTASNQETLENDYENICVNN